MSVFPALSIPHHFPLCDVSLLGSRRACHGVWQVVAGVDPRVAYALAACFGLAVLYVGTRTSWAVVFVLLVCLGMLVFAGYLARWVMAKDEGTVDMQEVGPTPRQEFWNMWLFP